MMTGTKRWKITCFLPDGREWVFTPEPSAGDTDQKDLAYEMARFISNDDQGFLLDEEGIWRKTANVEAFKIEEI